MSSHCTPCLTISPNHSDFQFTFTHDGEKQRISSLFISWVRWSLQPSSGRSKWKCTIFISHSFHPQNSEKWDAAIEQMRYCVLCVILLFFPNLNSTPWILFPHPDTVEKKEWPAEERTINLIWQPANCAEANHSGVRPAHVRGGSDTGPRATSSSQDAHNPNFI